MVFDARDLDVESGDLLYKDRFKQVEAAVSFRKAECYRCGFVGFYRYHVRQLRRNAEILCGPEEWVREDHRAIWESIPRFAEIPQTVRCRRCREVMGFYTACLF